MKADLEALSFAREVQNPAYARALRFDMTSAIRKQMLTNSREQLNMINSIYGKTGCGKSVLGWVMAEWNCEAYGLDMSTDYVFFENAELLQALEGSKAGETYIKDEQVEVFGEGSMQIASSLQNIEMTVREGEISLLYIGPELRLHSHHYIIRPVLKLWRQRPGVYKVLSWVYDGMKSTPAGNVPIGIIKTGLPKGTVVDEGLKKHRDKVIWSEEYLKYKEKKHKFIDDVKKGRISSGSDFLVNDIAEKFIKQFEDLAGLDSKKELKAILISDKRFRKNLTTGQMDTVAELVRIKCKLGNITTGLVKRRK